MIKHKFKKWCPPEGFVQFYFRDYDWDRIVQILDIHSLLDTPLRLENEEGAYWEVTFKKDAILYEKKSGEERVKVVANTSGVSEEVVNIVYNG